MSKYKLLRVGDIIELTEAHTVYADVPRCYIFSNCKGDFTLERSEARLDDPRLAYLRGKYVVIATKLGGGTGPNSHDPYPDGWDVTCENVDTPTIHVSFYETGCFTAQNEDIEPIGRREPVTTAASPDELSEWTEIAAKQGLSVETWLHTLARLATSKAKRER